MPSFYSAEDANRAVGLTGQAANQNTGGGGWRQAAWGLVKRAGAGLAGAALQGAGKIAGGYLSTLGGGIAAPAVNWAANTAQRAVNKMQDGVVKSGLNNFLKGVGASAASPAPIGLALQGSRSPLRGGGHREDRPLQGTAGKLLTTQKHKITDYFGTAPSNGTRNSNAVLSNSISGGYGEKESASKNPRHAGPMMSNQYVSESPKAPYGAVIDAVKKKLKRRRKHHRK